MSEAPFWIASTSTMLTSLTTGASSADSFNSKMSTLAPVSSSPSRTSTFVRSDDMSCMTLAIASVFDS